MEKCIYGALVQKSTQHVAAVAKAEPSPLKRVVLKHLEVYAGLLQPLTTSAQGPQRDDL